MWPWPEHDKQPIRTQTSHHCQAFGPSHLPGSTHSTWRDKKRKNCPWWNQAAGLTRAPASAPLIDFVEWSSAWRCTWMWTSGYTGTLIYSLVLCQHPAVTEPSLLNINNSWLTLILCNSTIVSGQGSIKFSSLSSFQLDGVLNISCYRPPGQVGVWLDERSRRTACRCPRRRTGPPPGDVVKIHCGCRRLVMSPVEVFFFFFFQYRRAAITLFLFSFFIFFFPFFLLFTVVLFFCSLFFSPVFSVKTPAKSVWWAAWWGPRRGPWRRLIWGLRCRCHRVQTNSHGNPGCGTPFSVSPRGPSLPPDSPPAPSWHRSGSYPSSWREKTQQALTPQAYDCSGRLACFKLNASSTREPEPRVEVIPESGTAENTQRREKASEDAAGEVYTAENRADDSDSTVKHDGSHQLIV